MSFSFDNLRRLGNKIEIRMPKDEEGFLGRECPMDACKGYFKVKLGTGLTGTDLPCVCAYCGYSAGHDEFWTEDQIEYAKSVGLRAVSEAVRKDLKKLEFDHKPRGAFGIGISMKLKPGEPVPLRHYREKNLETRVTCGVCALEYAVYGLFAYCPDCGEHNSLQILKRNTTLIRKQIALAEDLEDPDFRRYMLEDALENCVSAFDGFGREVCRVRSDASTNPSRAKNLSFQNLENAAMRVLEIFGVKLKSSLAAAEWELVSHCFMRRHLLAHKAGVIDERYISETGDVGAVVGRRVRITAEEVRRLSDLVERLGEILVSQLPEE